MNIYKFNASVTCPVDHRPCAIRVEVHAGTQMIWTEKIEEALEKLLKGEHSQEDFTKRLARQLGAKVVTDGQHGAFWIRSEHGASL